MQTKVTVIGEIMEAVLEAAVWYNVRGERGGGEKMWAKFISNPKYADHAAEAERMVKVLRMSMEDKMRSLYGLIVKVQRDAEDLFEMMHNKEYTKIKKTELKMLALYLNVNKNIEHFLEKEEFPRYPRGMHPGPKDSWFVKFASLPATDLSQCMIMQESCESALLRLLKNMGTDGPAYYGKPAVWEELDASSIWRTNDEVREATVDGLERYYFQYGCGDKNIDDTIGEKCPNIRFALYTRLYEKHGIGSKPRLH